MKLKQTLFVLMLAISSNSIAGVYSGGDPWGDSGGQNTGRPGAAPRFAMPQMGRGVSPSPAPRVTYTSPLAITTTPRMGAIGQQPMQRFNAAPTMDFVTPGSQPGISSFMIPGMTGVGASQARSASVQNTYSPMDHIKQHQAQQQAIANAGRFTPGAGMPSALTPYDPLQHITQMKMNQQIIDQAAEQARASAPAQPTAKSIFVPEDEGIDLK